MGRKAFLETRFITQSESNYETKLMELKICMDEAQRKLSQLDDLHNQLLRTQGHGVVELSNQTEFRHAQVGPINPSPATIYLGNQGEHYGARLDRTAHDSIAFSAHVNAMQTALMHTWEGSSLTIGLPLPRFITPSSGVGYCLDPISGHHA